VLITGVYGAGKSTVAADIADILERRRVPYGAIDLDWIMWFDTGRDDMDELGSRVFRANLADVVRNYLDVGIERFVLAGAIETRADLDGLRSAIAVPLTVVRLTVPLHEVVRRLRSDPTSGRQDDLQVAIEWSDAAVGLGLDDFSVANEGAVRDTSTEVLRRLGWLE
jgi:shikimate kinase